jgi:hypothetical protein
MFMKSKIRKTQLTAGLIDPLSYKSMHINCFMYRRALLCTFQIAVDFYYVPVGGRGGLESVGGNLFCTCPPPPHEYS